MGNFAPKPTMKTTLNQIDALLNKPLLEAADSDT
jgi:hypothetical protein